MPRLRTIKPGFFLNETLAEVAPLGRILFAGLWCIADREGRLEDRPRKIKAEVLPYDEADADPLLNDLAERGFISRYAVNGERYIQIVNFKKHQNPHVREAPSTIPALCKADAGPVKAGRDLGSLILDQGSIDPTTAVVGANAPTPTLGKADDSEVFSDTVKRLPRGKAARAMAVQLEVNLRQEYGDEWVDAAGENAIRLGKVDNRGSPIIGYVEGTCRGWVADGFKPPGGKPWERETRGDNGRGSTQNDPTASARRSNSNRRESEYANIAVTRIDTTPR